MSQKQRIVSGMRPTGKLHLGHYLGVLTNFVKLQEDYECFFFVADWHALTTKSQDTDSLKENVLNVVLDWLAAGVDPDKSVIYVQSRVPQIAELHIYLSMITPQNWVERDPTLKDLAKMVRTGQDDNKSGISYGLLGYPVLMAADIMMFNVDAIPVGIDQVAHIEIERDIARRFNNIYKTDLFKEAVPKLTNIPLLKGLDGNKMGKSFNNDIKISDDEETTAKKVMTAITDRSRARKDDPGHPDKCEVAFTYWQAFADEKTLAVLTEFAEKLGLAFQISDDILDETATLDTLGKTPHKDKAAGKVTYLSFYGMDEAKKRLAFLCESACDILNTNNINSEVLREIALGINERVR